MSRHLVLALLASTAVVAVAAALAGRVTTPASRLRVVRYRLAVARPLRLRRRTAPGDREVAAWCQRVAAGVRAGGSLTTAVVDADAASDPDRSPFPDVVHAIRRGQPLATAFREGGADPAAAGGLAGPVLATCAELGGATGAPIERVADVLLARAAEHDDRLAAAAQARLSARVLTMVPIGVALLLLVAEPAIRGAVASPAGALCVGAGLALDLVGWWWMRTQIGGAP